MTEYENRPPSQIIQITTGSYDNREIIALCEDGSIWRRELGSGGDKGWKCFSVKFYEE